MRPYTLQYFYLQKPLTLTLCIAAISVLCWIGMGAFYTKGEPREASVAVSMVEDGNWILPKVYADEFAYKPPLTHWMMAVFSLPQGKVDVFTARLPAALSFIVMIGGCFLFFGRRVRFQQAFLACLILITCFELHRAAMTARVDMTLTAFIVIGLIGLFKWEEKKALQGFPWITTLILSGGILAKGPVGAILPLLVFGVYLLFLRYNFWKIAGKCLLILIAALILPAIWYYLAWQKGGEEFFQIMMAENFGRFFGGPVQIAYNLGHDQPAWYYLATLLSGFIPWTLLVLFSLFGLKYSLKIPKLQTVWNGILHLPKIQLFSLLAILVIFIFYAIPTSKRSVYVMPAYPFIAFFLSQYILYLCEYKNKVIRVFSIVITLIGSIVALLCLSSVITHLLAPEQWFTNEKTRAEITGIWSALDNGSMLLYIVLTLTLLAFIYISFVQIRKKNNLKILYATTATYIAIFLVMDGIFFPAYKNSISVKPIALELQDTYPDIRENIFVMNNLMEYANMYGLNFYLHNAFQNFETVQPDQGYLLIGKNGSEKMRAEYNNRYHFELLESINNKCRDGERVILLFKITSKKGLK